jgi:hypothetical protein
LNIQVRQRDERKLQKRRSRSNHLLSTHHHHISVAMSAAAPYHSSQVSADLIWEVTRKCPLFWRRGKRGLLLWGERVDGPGDHEIKRTRR